jgi:NAD(P)H-hydrate epimerase
MRRADAAAIRGGVSGDDLMENAAGALAEAAGPTGFGWRRIVVVCGPGNNGGDGLAAARLLAARGAAVRLFTLGATDASRGDAAANARRALAVGLRPTPLAGPRVFAELRRALAESDGAVDALFGTGLSRPLRGAAARAVAAMNASGRPVLAADVPSGLSSDAGALLGPTVQARATIAFAAPKVCHVTFPARALCGEVRVADIGIPRRLLEKSATTRMGLVEPEDVRRLVPPRPLDAHKGSFGRLAIVAGSRGKTGAAILASRGALRAGAGLVTVFCGGSLERAVVAALPEAMTRGLAEEDGAIAEAAAGAAIAALRDFDALLVGPGLSTSPGTVAFVGRLLAATRLPVVADADALNAFAGRPAALRGRARVLTPHPGEAARLLGATAGDVQADRAKAARRLARRSGATVLLKGAATLVATPDGEIRVNPTGTPLLATAGAGDVLGGMLAAGLARGLEPADAAIAAAWLHGAAAERLAARLGDAGLLAAEVADAVPETRRLLLARGDAGPA